MLIKRINVLFLNPEFKLHFGFLKHKNMSACRHRKKTMKYTYTNTNTKDKKPTPRTKKTYPIKEERLCNGLVTWELLFIQWKPCVANGLVKRPIVSLHQNHVYKIEKWFIDKTGGGHLISDNPPPP